MKLKFRYKTRCKWNLPQEDLEECDQAEKRIYRILKALRNNIYTKEIYIQQRQCVYCED